MIPCLTLPSVLHCVLGSLLALSPSLSEGLEEQSSSAVLSKAGEGVSAVVLGVFLAWLCEPCDFGRWAFQSL